MVVHRRYKLLMVDDDPKIRDLTSMALAAKNFDVRQAENGVEALPILKHMLPHVLISDLQMPLMDGYELMRITRRFFPEIGVIALSGDYGLARIPGKELADLFFAKGAHNFAEFLERVVVLAAQYPVRPVARLDWLSPTWISPDKRPELRVECSNCDQSFALDRSSRPVRGGIYGTRCYHCGAAIHFLLEQRSLDAWITII